eukprot:CAMPEP_0116099716 /NCGR_PEP_ID=MMETSP0327-20121206/11915_1 /TAXON_ID=44447 /ORGANISM="Pseudo-nitzschia delicatissima, Strain B596" /LENGTH=415 /DNA_ID=CAMNT_0003591609 /DNA_START=54 /DNA_END=1298 /DNA_ORIENTATION=-
MDKSLIRPSDCKRIIGQCRDDSLDVDSNVADQPNDRRKQENERRNERQEIDFLSSSAIRKRQTTSGRSNLGNWPSNFVQIVLLVVIGCFHAQGFSSFTIRSDLSGTETLQHQQKIFTRSHPHNNKRQRRSCERTALFSTTEESTIPLDFMEYFSPEETQETPVLFLHGLLGSKRNFATCANMLAVQLDKKRRIMGVDLRNHGNTQPWSEEMTYPSMARDVVNFLKSQNIENVILVGHSMGGKVAQALALLYPEYVEGLVVLDIAPVTYSREEDPHWRAVEDILRAVHGVIEATEGAETTKREIDLELRKSIPDPALRAFVLTNYDSRTNEWKIPIATMVHELERIAGFDLKPEYDSSSTYDGDVFIINGGQSRFVRHSYMDQIASYFPNHMLTTIRGSGHWVHAEAPEDLVALLK